MPYNGGDIFDGHLLRPQHGMPLEAPPADPLWIGWYLVLCLALLVAVRSVAYPRAVRIVQSTFSNQILQQLEREEVNLFRSYALALNVLFMLNVAFLLYKYNENAGLIMESGSPFSQYAFLLGTVLAIAVFRLVVNRLLGAITDSRKIINDYFVSSTLINQTAGLALFPVLALLQYSSLPGAAFFWLATGVLALSVLLRWYRGLLMAGTEERLGFIEIFSYFCALEILPVLVLVKFVVETY